MGEGITCCGTGSVLAGPGDFTRYIILSLQSEDESARLYQRASVSSKSMFTVSHMHMQPHECATQFSPGCLNLSVSTTVDRQSVAE